MTDETLKALYPGTYVLPYQAWMAFVMILTEFSGNVDTSLMDLNASLTLVEVLFWHQLLREVVPKKAADCVCVFTVLKLV